MPRDFDLVVSRLSRRSTSKRRRPIPFILFPTLYFDEGLSAREIAKVTVSIEGGQTGEHCILDTLRWMGYKLRSRGGDTCSSQARKKRKCK